MLDKVLFRASFVRSKQFQKREEGNFGLYNRDHRRLRPFAVHCRREMIPLFYHQTAITPKEAGDRLMSGSDAISQQVEERGRGAPSSSSDLPGLLAPLDSLIAFLILAPFYQLARLRWTRKRMKRVRGGPVGLLCGS
jgi:hypothetical protein